MSGQILELIIFAGVALFIINKLISTLGSTSENDPARSKSFFGERAGSNLKDVTPSSSSAKIRRPKFLQANKFNLKDLVLPENVESVEAGLKELLEKIPSFDITRFSTGAKAALKMIIEAGEKNNQDELEELVDKRYIESFKSRIASYGSATENINSLAVHISEIYIFGNNVFIKVLFSGDDITDKITRFNEEWTFTKSSLSASPAWRLTNIDSSQ